MLWIGATTIVLCLSQFSKTMTSLSLSLSPAWFMDECWDQDLASEELDQPNDLISQTSESID